MTEAPDQASAAPGSAASEALSAGAILRQAREAAGLHVAAMAVALKVPVGKLEALEQDRYDQLPDAVFARALASSVCRTLKIDARPVLDRLPRTGKPRLIQDSDRINAPFRSPRDAVAPTWREQLTRPVSLVVGALLVGAVVVLLIPRHTEEAAGLAASDASPQRTAAAPTQALVQPAKPAVVASALAPPVGASGLVPASMTAAAPSAPAASQIKSAEPVAVSAPAAPAASAATPASAAAGGDDVVFRVKRPSWIEVRDAKGAVPVRKVLGAGESVNVSGAMPLDVVVGNVNATEVDVHGKRFDLQSVAHDNVARFQIQ